MIMSTCSIRAAPVPPRPVATWKTPSGRPHSRRPSASSKEVKGVTSEGLRITLLPAAKAGMQSPKEFVERIVPRADHADQAERAVAQDQLLALEHHRGRFDALVRQIVGGVLGPEAEGVGRRRRSRRTGRPRRSCRSRRRSWRSRARSCPSATSGRAKGCGRGPQSQTPPIAAGRRGHAWPARQPRRVEVGDATGDPARGRVLDGDVRAGGRRSVGPVVGVRCYVLLDGRHIAVSLPRFASIPSEARRPREQTGYTRLAVRPDFLLRQLDRGDADGLDRFVAAVGRHALELVDDVHPALHLTEHGVLAVQPRTRLGGDDEELGAVGVGARVGHRQRAAHDLVRS